MDHDEWEYDDDDEDDGNGNESGDGGSNGSLGDRSLASITDPSSTQPIPQNQISAAKCEQYMRVVKEVGKSGGVEEMYHCNLCDYKSKRKATLKVHLMLIHNVGDNITWYLCNHCNYKTKVKASLTKHQMLMHNMGDVPITWYRCTQK